jgi:hypothetical protein
MSGSHTKMMRDETGQDRGDEHHECRAAQPRPRTAQDAAMNIHISRSASRMSVRTIHLMLHLAQSCTGLMSTQEP